MLPSPPIAMSQKPPAETPGPLLSCPANQRCKVSWNSSTWIPGAHTGGLVMNDRNDKFWSLFPFWRYRTGLANSYFHFLKFSVISSDMPLTSSWFTFPRPAPRLSWRRLLTGRKAWNVGHEPCHADTASPILWQWHWRHKIGLHTKIASPMSPVKNRWKMINGFEKVNSFVSLQCHTNPWSEVLC